MINNRKPFPAAFRLLCAVIMATGVEAARADIEVKSSANGNPLGHANVRYMTSVGVIEVQTNDGGSVVYGPNGAPGRYDFSSTAQSPGGNSASTTCDTANGRLHSYAVGHSGESGSTAIIDDSVTFFNPNSQPVPITVQWTFEGSLTVSANGTENNGYASYVCNFAFGGHGNPFGNVYVEGVRNATDPSQNHDARRIDAWGENGTTYEIVPTGPSSLIFTGHCLLPPGESVWVVFQGLQTFGSGNGTGIGQADFGNTVGVAFELPPGVSFNSPSGFLGSGSRMVNIATRADVLSGDSVAIAGFIIAGNVPKKVIIRGIGPSLAAVGVAGALADSTLELRQNQTLLASNDNWRDTQETEIQATGIPPSNDLESAIVRTLDPGSYTAVLRGKNDGTGIGLIEVYDLQASADSKLANISTRAQIEAGDNVMIGGIIGGGNGSQPKVLIRAIGPSLTPLGVANALQNPLLELHDNNGALIASNDDWQSDHQAEIQATGLAPTNIHESAILATLLPTNYTAIVKGVNNTSGVGLVEIYHLQ